MTETTTRPTPTAPATRSTERDDLVALLERHRGFFLYTLQGLTEEQVRLTPTVSTLSLGGLVKHVTAMVGSWLDFIEHGAPEQQGGGDTVDEAVYEAFAEGFRLLPAETLAGALDAYAAVSARAVELARTVDLDAGRPLPVAPWFPVESWSNRRVLVHLIAEIAQHAGHADIIRETIDGQHTMG